jgi:polyisoprenoid-binding protein YceI
MSTFAVDNIPNSGIRSLFLDHIRGEEFLDVDGYPFAQFVLDEVIYGAESISSGDDVLNEVMEIYGRLKIKDVIEPVVLRDVVMEQQGDDVLFVSGTLSVSRYLW